MAEHEAVASASAEDQIDSAAAFAEGKARQARNKIRGWHHHAIRTKDMMKTREFYEGVLGLPLSGTWIEKFDPATQAASNYMHCFFELGDGSALAFFQLEEGLRDDPIPMPRDPFEHHIALAVDSIADVNAFKEKFEAACYQPLVVDHGYCYSIYVLDPNDMFIEVSSYVPNGEVMLAEAAQTADRDMRNWREGNNRYRGQTDVGGS